MRNRELAEALMKEPDNFVTIGKGPGTVTDVTHATNGITVLDGDKALPGTPEFDYFMEVAGLSEPGVYNKMIRRSNTPVPVYHDPLVREPTGGNDG